jgi:hypothetical protein
MCFYNSLLSNVDFVSKMSLFTYVSFHGADENKIKYLNYISCLFLSWKFMSQSLLLH